MSRRYLAVSLLMLGAIFTPVSTTLYALAQDKAQPQDKTQTQDKKQPPAKAGKNQAAAAKTGEQSDDDGQRVFEQNCSRCHNAPEGFSPRITGTIVRHMRVRANLSKEDEQKLLRFFNP